MTQTTGKRSLPRPPFPSAIACFSLCQEIGMELEERGKNISMHGIFFPALYDHTVRELESVKAFADRALKAISLAKEQAEKEMAA